MIVLVTSFFFFSCEKDQEEDKLLPELTITSVEELSQTSLIAGGTIISDGGLEITDKGVCWGFRQNPTINDQMISAGSGSGSFEVTIVDLEPDKYYYLRAFATNNMGTGYGDEITFSTQSMITDSTTTEPVVDVDGNLYPVVRIGDQVWMAKNLQVTRFRDGTEIPNVEGEDQWGNLTTPAYAWYDNVNNQYGLLYNGYSIANDDLCPEGWHLPDTAEWNTLIETVGGKEVAGGKLKETGTVRWMMPNVGATDEYRFTALPGGLRYVDGEFRNKGKGGYWWAAPGESLEELTGPSIGHDQEKVNLAVGPPKFGSSIRCVKD